LRFSIQVVIFKLKNGEDLSTSEVFYMDSISGKEVERSLEALGYKETAKRIHEMDDEAPLYSQNL
jgi:hypothetical protein